MLMIEDPQQSNSLNNRLSCRKNAEEWLKSDFYTNFKRVLNQELQETIFFLILNYGLIIIVDSEYVDNLWLLNSPVILSIRFEQDLYFWSTFAWITATVHWPRRASQLLRMDLMKINQRKAPRYEADNRAETTTDW